LIKGFIKTDPFFDDFLKEKTKKGQKIKKESDTGKSVLKFDTC